MRARRIGSSSTSTLRRKNDAAQRRNGSSSTIIIQRLAPPPFSKFTGQPATAAAVLGHRETVKRMVTPNAHSIVIMPIMRSLRLLLRGAQPSNELRPVGHLGRLGPLQLAGDAAGRRASFVADGRTERTRARSPLWHAPKMMTTIGILHVGTTSIMRRQRHAGTTALVSRACGR